MISKTDERRHCPSCFQTKVIPPPLPVCVSCIKLVPPKLQTALANALISGDAKEILRATGEAITAAWSAVAEKKKAAPAEMSAGARWPK